MYPDQVPQMQEMVCSATGVGVIIGWVVAYLFFAFLLAKIAEKLGHPFSKSFVMAIIPIVNLVLILQLAKKPIWWIILMIIPIVNIVISVLVWMSICEQRGRSKWLALLILVPIANLVLMLILAFGDQGGRPVVV